MSKHKKNRIVEGFAEENLRKLTEAINKYAKNENLKIVQVSYALDENCNLSECALVVFESN